MRRADLYRALRIEAEKRGIETRYGKRLTGASQTSSQVRASFADGTHASGDLLVGADGLRSTLRRIIDPDAPSPRYVPFLNTGGFARDVRVPDPPGVMNMVFGRRCFYAHVVHPDGSIWWFANVPRKREPTESEPASLNGESWRAELLRLVAPDRTPAAEIIRATPEVYAPWPTYDYPSVPVWHRGRMVIIGDAAHVERVVAQGKKNGDAKVVGPVGRILRDWFITRAFKKPSGEDPNRFMWDHHIDWAAPVPA